MSKIIKIFAKRNNNYLYLHKISRFVFLNDVINNQYRYFEGSQREKTVF